MDIIRKLKKTGLVGRGGACFPTWLKWDMVNKAEGSKKYVICNASEGEPGIMKDYYILKHYPEDVVNGIKIAINFLSFSGTHGRSFSKNSFNKIQSRRDGSLGKNSTDNANSKQKGSVVKGYIFLNPTYYKKLSAALRKIINNAPIEVFMKSHIAGYIGGEETSAINAIEGRRIEPRRRPPYPPTNGLWGCPTLINNVETLYDVSLIESGQYKNKRYYTINGDCLWTGVYCFNENWTIEKILRQTKNYPDFDFFVQVGGNASGEILNNKQIKRKASGAASITVYSIIKHQPLALMRQWIDFFIRESCGQCTPCREGVYRAREILYSKRPDWHMLVELLNNLSETSFCGLGCTVPISFISYFSNVLPNLPNNKINLGKDAKRLICECLK